MPRLLKALSAPLSSLSTASRRTPLAPISSCSIASSSTSSPVARLLRPSVYSAGSTLSPNLPQPLSDRLCLPSSLLSRSALSPRAITPLTQVGSMMQVRYTVLGAFYQPSQRKRKRKHGFLARLKDFKFVDGKKVYGGGRKMLARRLAKGRRFLSH